MSLIKSLIQRLLDSRTTPAQASNSAMPSENQTAITLTTTATESWTLLGSGIAPFDGYLELTVRDVANSTGEGGVLVSSGTLGFSTTSPFKNAQYKCTLPIQKGKSWSMAGTQVKEATAKFVRTIGWGGVQSVSKLILQGGAICLNSLSSSLRRSSLQTRKSGSVISPIAVTCLLSYPLSTGLSLRTRLPRTVSCALMAKTPRPLILSITTIYCALIFPENNLRLWRDSFRYQKVKPLGIHSSEKQVSKTELGFFRLLAHLHNNFVGGASC